MIGFNPNPAEPAAPKMTKKEPGFVQGLVTEVQSRWIRADVYLLACFLCLVFGYLAGRQ